uniref:Caspase 12 (gene/pseudogene) n=1 Tax=Balaenoptera musculus TaxID=9771 RepID=A0A8C0CSP1_BALMU
LTEKRPPKEDPVNMVKLMARNVLDGIFDDLMENKVLTRGELQRLGEEVDHIVNRTGDLVDDLTEKTQMAGKIFKDRFFNPKKQLSLSEYLSKGLVTCSLSTILMQFLSSYFFLQVDNILFIFLAPSLPASQPGKLKLCPPDHFHTLKTTKEDEMILMENEGWTRLALIICNKEFDYLSNQYGSEVDLLGMQDLLENLGYSVVVKEDLTVLEMETALRQFAARQEHQSSDSTFLVFMSHGIMDGICGSKNTEKDPDILRDDTIFQIFNSRNCQSLKDKPKVIIMQACAGVVWVTDMGEASAYRYDQFLQCSIWNDAITKSNVSWILYTNGSLFISQLIYYFNEYSWCYHLEEIFRKVQHSFETPNVLTQMPTIERLSMIRYFYLFPGN